VADAPRPSLRRRRGGLHARPAELSRNVTAFASDMYVFRTQEPRDLVYLTGYLGRDAAAVVEELPLPVITSSTLTVQYVHWTLRAGASRPLSSEFRGAWNS